MPSALLLGVFASPVLACTVQINIPLILFILWPVLVASASRILCQSSPGSCGEVSRGLPGEEIPTLKKQIRKRSTGYEVRGNNAMLTE